MCIFGPFHHLFVKDTHILIIFHPYIYIIWDDFSFEGYSYDKYKREVKDISFDFMRIISVRNFRLF